MDVKVRVLYAWPNDQLSPDLADLWPNVGMAMAILDFMSIGIDTKRDWQMKSFSWCLPLNAKEGYRCVILILTSPLRYIWEQVACILWRTAAEVTVQNLELVARILCMPTLTTALRI